MPSAARRGFGGPATGGMLPTEGWIARVCLKTSTHRLTMKSQNLKQNTVAKNPNQGLRAWLTAGWFGLVLSASTGLSLAATTNYIVDQFDLDTTGAFVNQYWGSVAPAIAWDDTVNQTSAMGPNNPGSGSAKWVVDWSGGPLTDQIMVVRGFANSTVLDLNNYTNVTFDLRFDAASATDGNGSFGGVELDWVPRSDGWPSTPAAVTTFASSNANWVHVALPVDASVNSKLSAVNGLGFKMQRSRTGSALTGVTTFWMDNIILGARAAAPAPPKLALTPVTTPPGLMVVASGGGNDYKRGMIRTLDPINGIPSYSWVGQGSTPVTYSITIASYPDTNHSYLQSQIFLVPNGGNDSSIDYTAASCIALDIRNQPDGTATGAFRYKTNNAYANASDYVPATLVCASGALGTWSLTFLNDTNVTVTAPNGAHTNFFLPDEATAQVFSNPLSAYFGNQQNGPGNAGQASTYSHVKITGVTYSAEIDDLFLRAELNPDPGNPVWQVVCDIPSDVFLVHATDKYWASWTLPDTGFSLQSSPSLAAGSWENPGLTNIIYTTLGNKVLVPQDALPSATRGFFRLAKPVP